MNGIPTPQHYVAAASAGYTGFRDMVVDAAKRWLAMTKASGTSTKEMTDALWPNHLAHGTDIDIRKRMVDTLLKCATRELSMCARRGPVMGKAYGHAKRPWLWSAPPAPEMATWGSEEPGRSDHVDHGGTPHDDNPADIKQALVDCIGASPAGQWITLRDRAAIADDIMKKTIITLQ